VVNGDHTIVPGKAGYTFTPTQKTVTMNGANLSGQNFTGTGPQQQDRLPGQLNYCFE
jgi:hypothetical protein